MEIAVEVWYSLPGTILLYGAFAVHFMMALFAVYERRTFRLPPLELLRIVLGFTMPILLIGHAASTRLAYELFGLSSDYTRVVANLWATGSQGWQLGLMAPGWLHGCLGLHFAFSRRRWYRQFRFALFSAAHCCCRCWRPLASSPWAKSWPPSPAAVAAALEYLNPDNAAQRLGDRAVEGQSPQLVFFHYRRGLHRARNPQSARTPPQAPRLDIVSRPDRACAARLVGAGSEPQLPSAARGDVRGPGPVLDLPGAGDGRRGALPAGGQR